MMSLIRSLYANISDINNDYDWERLLLGTFRMCFVYVSRFQVQFCPLRVKFPGLVF